MFTQEEYLVEVVKLLNEGSLDAAVQKHIQMLNLTPSLAQKVLRNPWIVLDNIKGLICELAYVNYLHSSGFKFSHNSNLDIVTLAGIPDIITDEDISIDIKATHLDHPYNLNNFKSHDADYLVIFTSVITDYKQHKLKLTWRKTIDIVHNNQVIKSGQYPELDIYVQDICKKVGLHYDNSCN